MAGLPAPGRSSGLRSVALAAALERAGSERVELACAGGRGRTGTAIGVMAILDGIEPADTFRWVRSNYHPDAIETPWQRLWLRTIRRPDRGR